MKTLLLLLFVLALTTTSLANNHPLVDTSGKPLLNGAGRYYISPIFWPGEPVQLALTGSETCPRTVIQPGFGSGGIPVRFSSPLFIAQISTSMRLHVDFLPPHHKPFTCLPSPARWKVDDDGSVKIVEEGEQTGLVGPFRIEAIGGREFKLQYCEGEDDESCKDIGLSNDRRLIVKDGEPLRVIFILATRHEYENEGIRMID